MCAKGKGMNRCKTCDQVFKTKSAHVSHNKSVAHAHQLFVKGHKKFWMPVTPAQLELLQKHGLKTVEYGPRVITRPGWIHQKEKTRANPWVKKTEVRRVLTLGAALDTLLRRAS